MKRFVVYKSKIAMSLLFAGYAFAVLATLPHYGITWDEIFHYISGDMYLEYFRTTELRIEENSNLRYYGPVVDVLSAVSNKQLHLEREWLDEDIARHLPGTLLGILVLPLVFSMVARTSGRRAAFFSVLALALCPHFFSYVHNDPKDIGLTFFYTGVLWAAVHRVRGGGPIWILVAAILFGLGYATKLTIVLTAPILVIWFVLQMPRWGSADDRRRATERLAELAIVIPALGLLFGILFWPWMWVDSFHRVYLIFHHFMNVPWLGPVLYRGEILTTDKLGWEYAIWMFTIQNPIWIMSLAALGVLRTIWRWRRRRRTAMQLAFVGLAVTLGMATRTPGQTHDGLRQLLPVLPLLSILAGSGAEGLWRMARRFDLKRVATGTPRRRVRLAAAAILTAGFATALWAIVSMHPDQTAFFNRLVGGPAGADGNYEVEFYCNPYKRGMQWIEENADGYARVVVPLNHYVAGYYTTPKTQVVPYEGKGDYFMELPRMYLEAKERPENVTEVHRITARGATVLRIFKFVKPSPAPR